MARSSDVKWTRQVSVYVFWSLTGRKKVCPKREEITIEGVFWKKELNHY